MYQTNPFINTDKIAGTIGGAIAGNISGQTKYVSLPDELLERHREIDIQKYESDLELMDEEIEAADNEAAKLDLIKIKHEIESDLDFIKNASIEQLHKMDKSAYIARKTIAGAIIGNKVAKMTNGKLPPIFPDSIR